MIYLTNEGQVYQGDDTGDALIQPLPQIAHIFGRGFHWFLLTTEGQVYRSSEPYQLMEGLSQVIDAELNDQEGLNVLFLTRSGQVYAMGENRCAQLGQPQIDATLVDTLLGILTVCFSITKVRPIHVASTSMDS